MHYGAASAGTARQPTCPNRTPPHVSRTSDQTARPAPQIPTAAFRLSLGSHDLQNHRSGNRQRPPLRCLPMSHLLPQTLRLSFPAPVRPPSPAAAQPRTGARALPSQPPEAAP